MEVNPKDKSGFVKLLGSIIMGLAFLCLVFFAGFGGKIEGFVKGADEPTTGGTTSSYENAMIYVDSGATTNITGGRVGAMSNGNSVYVADGGTLNVTGGTVSGNIYNGGTLNYTAGTLNSVTLASGKYITFKGNPSSTISITLYGGASVGETVGYLDGISSVTLSRLSVTNLPANTELRIEGGYIKIRYVNRTVTITASPSGYGSVSGSSITIPHGSSVSVSGSTLSYGGTSITATPANQTEQYTYSFDGWYVGDTQITSSRTITANTTITARFTRTTRTYTVTITRNYTSYGTVSRSSVTNVPYGTVLSASSNTLNVNGTTVTATPTTASARYSYSFSNWTNGTATVTGNLTVTANFSRSTRSYYIYAYARYSTSSSGTNSGATAGITGGTATITYGSTDTPTTGSSYVRDYVAYNGTVTLTAEAKTGYVFVGWYSNSTSNSAVSTSSSYNLSITGTTYRYAFFKRASYTITIAVSPSGYGSVSQTSVTADYGTSISASGSTLSIGSTAITATAASQTAQYTYAFSSWSNASGTVTGAKTITANFTRTTRTYTVTIAVSPSGYGSVSQTSVTNVPYGTVLSQNGNTLNVNGTTVTATPATASAQYTYAFSNWANGTATVTGNLTVTAMFSRSTRGYGIYVYARYSTSSSGTNSGATFGITGGTATITYGSTNTTTTGSSHVRDYVTYNESVTLTAEAATGYVFVGWYSSATTTTASSTSSSYSLNITGTTFRYAFFRRASYTITLTVGDGQSTNLGWFVVAGAPYAATYQFKVPYGETFSLTPSSATCSFTIPSGTVMLQIRDNTTENITMYNSNTGTYHYLPDVDTLQYTVTSSFTISFIETTYHTVTIQTSNSSYGTVSRTSVSNVPLGGEITLGTSSNILSVNGTTSTATASSATSRYTYSFSSWRLGSTSGTQITSTGTTISGDTTIYAVFTRSVRPYTIRIGARYSTSPSGTNSSATGGITGGYATLTYGSSTITTTGSGLKSVRVAYNTTLTFIAYASSGYTFVGWYASTSSTTAASSREQLVISATSNHTYYAFFRKILSSFTDFDPSNLNITTNEYKINNLNLSDIDLSENTMDNESIAIFNSKKQLLVFIDKKIG